MARPSRGRLGVPSRPFRTGRSRTFSSLSSLALVTPTYPPPPTLRLEYGQAEPGPARGTQPTLPNRPLAHLLQLILPRVGNAHLPTSAHLKARIWPGRAGAG